VEQNKKTYYFPSLTPLCENNEDITWCSRPTLVSGGQESDQKRLFLPLSLQDDDRSTQMGKLKDKGKCIDAMNMT